MVDANIIIIFDRDTCFIFCWEQLKKHKDCWKILQVVQVYIRSSNSGYVWCQQQMRVRCMIPIVGKYKKSSKWLDGLWWRITSDKSQVWFSKYCFYKHKHSIRGHKPNLNRGTNPPNSVCIIYLVHAGNHANNAQTTINLMLT